MTNRTTAFVGANIFDGVSCHSNHALIVRNGLVKSIVGNDDIPAGTAMKKLDGGTLSPGFVDLQVNGGGGLMFNADPSVETLCVIANAHRKLGATSILPTIITDTKDVTAAAINATADAIADGATGIAGLHLEGPHLSALRKGAHDDHLIRNMDDDDLQLLLAAAKRLPVLKMTLAPESVSFDQMKRLSDGGVLLSLGHSNATYDTCVTAAEAGVTCVTHLFNAMSQLQNREPGVVGAALGIGTFSAGLIADLIHVHPQSIRTALSAKIGPGKIFLVSDAMAPAGSDIRQFELNGREITRNGNQLTLSDGTLAGANLDLATAVRNLVNSVGVPLAQALAMATSIPAGLIDPNSKLGRLTNGARADLVHLNSSLQLQTVWSPESLR